MNDDLKNEADIDYNDGNWHKWSNGPRPIHPRSRVDLVIINGPNVEKELNFLARDCNFEGGPKGDIALFKVVFVCREKDEILIGRTANGKRVVLESIEQAENLGWPACMIFTYREV